MFNSTDPLFMVRGQFQRLLTDGVACPCCDRWSKIYKRTLNNTMIRSLEWMAEVTLFPGQVINVPEAARRDQAGYDYGKQYSTLRWWDLIEPTEGSGNWIVTDKGFRFLNGTGGAPAWVHTNNGEVVASGPDIYIDEVDSNYDHEETMAPIGEHEQEEGVGDNVPTGRFVPVRD